jgi:hypothetical protein
VRLEHFAQVSTTLTTAKPFTARRKTAASCCFSSYESSAQARWSARQSSAACAKKSRIVPLVKRIEKMTRRSESGPATADETSSGQTELYAKASQGKSASGKRASHPAAKLGQATLEPWPSDEGPIVRPCNVRLEGYSLHASVAIHANDREALVRLPSTLARGPLATKRLSQLADGRLAYTLKRRCRDGTVAIALTKRELIERLAAQVPRPREHLTRYAGVLAPNHTMRRRVCRDRESVREEERLQTKRNLVQRVQEARCAQPSQAARSCEPLPTVITRRTWKWADLLQRVFNVGILECPKCGARCKELAVLADPLVVAKFLEAVGESTIHANTDSRSRAACAR